MNSKHFDNGSMVNLKLVKVYHYTDKVSMQKILNSDFIYRSSLSGPDAVFGEGVYLTTLAPKEGSKRIASNNWGHNNSSHMVEKGRVDCAIKLWIPESNLVKVNDPARDIWIHKGDIKLSSYPHTVIGNHLCGQSQPAQSSQHTKFARGRSTFEIMFALIIIILVVGVLFFLAFRAKQHGLDPTPCTLISEIFVHWNMAGGHFV